MRANQTLECHLVAAYKNVLLPTNLTHFDMYLFLAWDLSRFKTAAQYGTYEI